ncbi:PD-(D/E)XK nuclease family protein [Acholeplasma hippikon]|uniref:PD-(D/E)XK nuclease family protein n=1 Tax=Acholeplasma hippikon TaxID=264636 RepID=UPI0013C33FD8|nr:PD-(D/E)XK nuclease family protein [Acholeplasma hippikon]
MMKIKELFNILNKNDLLVLNNAIKNEFIAYKSTYELKNRKILPFKVLGEKDFLNYITFSCDDEVILNALESLNLPISIINEMLSFIQYDIKNHEALMKFYEANEKFFNKHQKFMNYIQDKKIYFIEEPIYLKEVLKKLNISYEVIHLTYENEVNVKKFTSKQHELLHLFEDILKELSNGTRLGDLYLSNVTEADLKEIKKYASIYQIPINLNEKVNLFDYKLTKELAKLSISELRILLNDELTLKKKYEDYINFDENLFNQIIDHFIEIINKYPNDYEEKLLHQVLLYELKSRNIQLDSIKDAINVVSLDSIPYLVDKKVYIIHAVYEVFPSIYKDNAYLSDKEKKLIGYPTSQELNLHTYNYLSNLIKHENIKYISFSIKDKYTTYAPSDIILPYVKKDFDDLNINDLTSNRAISIYKDLFKNNESGKNLVMFTPGFKLNPDEKRRMDLYLKQSIIKFTPTQLIEYIKSPFMFYIKHILLLSNYKIDVSTKIGNFFHTLVEVMYLINFKDVVEVEKSSLNDPELIIYIEKHINLDVDSNKLFEDVKTIYFKHEINLVNKIVYENDFISLDKKLAIETLFFVDKNKERMIRALTLLLELESDEPSYKLYVEKEISYQNYKGRADLIKVHPDERSFSIMDFKSSAKESFSKDKIIELLTILDENYDAKINLKQLSLLQLIIYAYLLSVNDEKLIFRDVSFFSFLESDLKLNSLQTTDLNTKYYISRDNRKIESYELTDLYQKLESLLGEVAYRIKNLLFENEVRKSTDYKHNLKNEDYKAFQAITFYSKYSLEQLEDSLEDD